MLPVLRKRVYLSDFYHDFFGKDLLGSFFSDGADYRVPAVNIKENDKGFTIELAAPGLKKEDIIVKVENDTLSISSSIENEKKREDENYMRHEFNFKSFNRTFSIPENVDQEKISANNNNGVLTVELPKLEDKKVNKSKLIKVG